MFIKLERGIRFRQFCQHQGFGEKSVKRAKDIYSNDYRACFYAGGGACGDVGRFSVIFY